LCLYRIETLAKLVLPSCASYLRKPVPFFVATNFQINSGFGGCFETSPRTLAEKAEKYVLFIKYYWKGLSAHVSINFFIWIIWFLPKKQLHVVASHQANATNETHFAIGPANHPWSKEQLFRWTSWDIFSGYSGILGQASGFSRRLQPCQDTDLLCNYPNMANPRSLRELKDSRRLRVTWLNDPNDLGCFFSYRLKNRARWNRILSLVYLVDFVDLVDS
jgi:hypothetical protein